MKNAALTLAVFACTFFFAGGALPLRDWTSDQQPGNPQLTQGANHLPLIKEAGLISSSSMAAWPW